MDVKQKDSITCQPKGPFDSRPGVWRSVFRKPPRSPFASFLASLESNGVAPPLQVLQSSKNSNLTETLCATCRPAWSSFRCGSKTLIQLFALLVLRLTDSGLEVPIVKESSRTNAHSLSNPAGLVLSTRKLPKVSWPAARNSRQTRPGRFVLQVQIGETALAHLTELPECLIRILGAVMSQDFKIQKQSDGRRHGPICSAYIRFCQNPKYSEAVAAGIRSRTCHKRASAPPGRRPKLRR